MTQNRLTPGCAQINGASAAYRDLLTIRITEVVSSLAEAGYTLHPVQADGADDVVKAAHYTAGTGTFAVPGRTVAVFTSHP